MEFSQRARGEAPGVATALRDINGVTVAMIPAADYAGITLVGQGGDVTTLGATHSLPHLLDDLQREFREGPCLTGAWEQHIVRVDDLHTDRRWLGFRVAAIQHTPIRSMLSFKLFEDDLSAAALNLYSERRKAFDDDAIELGLVLAAHTSLAWTTLRGSRRFESALLSRDVIGQAKGIVMERFAVDGVAAFGLLRRMASEADVGLNVIAERLTRSGSRQLPGIAGGTNHESR